jgi:predicted dienelactone hydrolase
VKLVGRRTLVTIAIVVAGIAGSAFLLKPTPVNMDGVSEQNVVIPDPKDKTLAVHIWYPTVGEENLKAIGTSLPLIVISHGAGGGLTGHPDTAIALTKAGFVVAAVEHTGDNYKDQSYVGKGTQLVGRPRHVALLIDYMLKQWPQHARIDPARIGMFGHSAGGFTALVLAGATPDMTMVAAHCRALPNDWGCNYVKSYGLNPDELAKQTHIDWVRDPRIKAAVIAAPALGYTFAPNGLSQVKIPVAIWEAQHDTIVDDSASTIRHMLPDSTEYHMVDNALHVSFLAPCDRSMRMIITVLHWFGTMDICEDNAGFDRTKFHEGFNKNIVAFFQKTIPATVK